MSRAERIWLVVLAALASAAVGIGSGWLAAQVWQ
jgi:hypothetical protein